MTKIPKFPTTVTAAVVMVEQHWQQKQLTDKIISAMCWFGKLPVPHSICSHFTSEALWQRCKIMISAAELWWKEQNKIRNKGTSFSGNDAYRKMPSDEHTMCEWASDWALFKSADMRMEQPIDCTLYVHLRVQSLALLNLTSSLFRPPILSPSFIDAKRILWQKSKLKRNEVSVRTVLTSKIEKDENSIKLVFASSIPTDLILTDPYSDSQPNNGFVPCMRQHIREKEREKKTNLFRPRSVSFNGFVYAPNLRDKMFVSRVTILHSLWDTTWPRTFVQLNSNSNPHPNPTKNRVSEKTTKYQ